MQVALVYRSGGEYKDEHVTELIRQIEANLPFDDIKVFSDRKIPNCHVIPLRYNWPGWWSKMELFRGDIAGDFLYFDLDTVIVDDLAEIAGVKHLTILRDFYRPAGLQSSVMFLPEADRRAVWKEWSKDPMQTIRHYQMRGVGDQAFLESLWLGKVQLWQDILPGQIVSYKVHCKNKQVPFDARVICAHGTPKPWNPAWKLNRGN